MTSVGQKVCGATQGTKKATPPEPVHPRAQEIHRGRPGWPVTDVTGHRGPQERNQEGTKRSHRTKTIMCDPGNPEVLTSECIQ